MGPDWFDVVRQPVVSKSRLSGACKHAPSGSVGNSTAAWVQSSDILLAVLKVPPQLRDLEQAPVLLRAFLSLSVK